MAFLTQCCKKLQSSYLAYGYAIFLLTPSLFHLFCCLCCSHRCSLWIGSNLNTTLALAAIRVHHLAIHWDFYVTLFVYLRALWLFFFRGGNLAFYVPYLNLLKSYTTIRKILLQLRCSTLSSSKNQLTVWYDCLAFCGTSLHITRVFFKFWHPVKLVKYHKLP